ncbi:hypothetical protein AB4Y88_00065 [Paenarthrobacter sp. RAF9]
MRRPGGTRLAIVGATLIIGVLASVGATAASFVDRANLNISSEGIGSPYRFDIGIVTPANTVEQADGPNGYDLSVNGAAALVPGHSVTTTIRVFNNTPELNAATTLSLVARNGDGTVAAGIPNITPYLRFTATTSAGTLFSAVKLDQATASLGQLAARQAAPLIAGATYTPGPAGSQSDVTLTIDYLDAPGVEALNGGQSAITVKFDATSVHP